MTLVALLLLLLLLGAVACSSNNDARGGEAMTMTTSGSVAATSPLLLGAEAFASYLEDNPEVPVVNVHIPYEGHIEGTDAFVPFEEIGLWADLPEDRSAPIVLYCRSGRMSATAAETLSEMGYTDIVDLDGGMNAWTDAGLELLTDPPPGAEAPD
jgi:phage shock protein E